MYPEQQSQPQQPQPEQRPPYQPPVAEQPVAPTKNLKLPIILMAWPAATLILVVLLSFIVNALVQDAPTNSELFGEANPIKTTMNVIFFIMGGAAFILGPISFIVGLVLLIQRKSKR